MEQRKALYTRNAVLLITHYARSSRWRSLDQKHDRFPQSGDGPTAILMAACEANARDEGYMIITYDNVLTQAKAHGYEEEMP